MARLRNPPTKSAPFQPGLSPRFCARFHGVCAECPISQVLIGRPRADLEVEVELPPLAARAIQALSMCHRLTQRESDVLALVCAGRENGLIASDLGISVSAVRRHLRNLHKKTHTADKVDLILNLWYSCRGPAAESVAARTNSPIMRKRRTSAAHRRIR